jgi:glyoxylase-like metal-dependent hydrolase (beta-lactamase superfamily II)
MLISKLRFRSGSLSVVCALCLVLICVSASARSRRSSPASPGPKAKPLHLLVYVSSENSFGVTSTLVYGNSEAILIDAQLHTSEAAKLADRIAATGTALKAIFITHPDVDHYIGTAVLHQRFPKAPIYMTAKALAHFKSTVDQKLAGVRKYFPSETPSSVPTPEALPSSHLTVDGQSVEMIPDLQGDVLEPANSFVWIPSLRAVVAGDIVFNGVHVFLADSDEQSRANWLKSIQRITSLHPLIVVAGHKGNSGLPDNPAAPAFTRQYITDFDATRKSSSNADQVVATMKQKYPQCSSEFFLKLSASRAFAQSRHVVGCEASCSSFLSPDLLEWASHAVQNTLVAQQRGHDIPNQLLIAGFRDNSELRSGGLNIDKGTAGAD